MSLSQLGTTFWFELSSFLISVLLFNRLKNTAYFYFIPILFLIVVGEYTGAWYRFVLQKQNNYWIYNWSTLFQVSFWILFLRHFLEKRQLRRLSIILFAFFLLFSVINLFFIQKQERFNNYSLVVGAAIIILQCCLFFYIIMNQESRVNLLKRPMFWIATGALFFYAATFFYFSLFDYLREHKLEKQNKFFFIIVINFN